MRLLVVGERPKPENRIFYPRNPERKPMRTDWWDDVPVRPMGDHDGLPDKVRDRRAGRRRPASRLPHNHLHRVDGVAHPGRAAALAVDIEGIDAEAAPHRDRPGRHGSERLPGPARVSAREPPAE